MNLSYKIRKIQNSESESKVRDVQSIFDNLISNCIKEICLLRTISKVVSSNVEGIQNFDDFALPKGISYEDAQVIGARYGLKIIQGGSGTIYLSWSRSLEESEEESLCKRLYEAGHNGIIDVEFNRLKNLFPEKKLELLFTSGVNAERKAKMLEKRAYPIYEDTIYLLCK